MASKQDNYLRMHHPSIYKGMKKGGKIENYKKGGKVACYAQGGYNTDTVPAMLTPGEVVLNQDQQESLGNMMAGGGKAGGGQARAAALFKAIGVPGYQEGVYLSGDKVSKTPEYTGETHKQTGMPMFSATGSYEVETPGGKRWYEGTSQSPDMQTAIGRSQYDALFKAQKSPSDSLITGGVRPSYEQPKLTEETKKKGLFGSLFKAGGGLVEKKDALMSYYRVGGMVTEEVPKEEKTKKKYESLLLPMGNYRMTKDTTFTMPKRKFMKEMRKLKPTKK